MSIIIENIKELEKNVDALGKKVNGNPISLDIEEHLLTKRQISKRIISNGGDMSGVNQYTGDIMESNLERAHLIVYGKFKYDENNNLIDNEIEDPDCVDKEKSLPDTGPMMQEIKDKIDDVKKSVKEVGKKLKEIGKTVVDLTMQSITSFVTLVSSAVVMPFGSGVSTGYSALLSILSNLQSFLTILNQLISLIAPLKSIKVLVKPEMYNTVDSTIGNTIGTINGLIEGVNDTIGSVITLKDILYLSPPPGIINTPDGINETPPNPLKIEQIISVPNTIVNGLHSTLNVIVSNGIWNYEYKWYESDTYKYIGDGNNIKVYPNKTTDYFVKIKNKYDNKNLSHLSKQIIDDTIVSSNVTVTVIQQNPSKNNKKING
jgi:hypothetical protein